MLLFSLMQTFPTLSPRTSSQENQDVQNLDLTMVPFLRGQRMLLIMLFSSFFAVKGITSSVNITKVTEAGNAEEICPPCEVFFRKLEKSGSAGKLVQTIRVQERGEPKSGTGVLYTWGTEALLRTCDYLQDIYGEGSCRFDAQMKHGDKNDRHPDHTMVFEPALGSNDARCSCETIERVSITIRATQKHLLPVSKTCAYSHGGNLMIGDDQAEGTAGDPPCIFADGMLPTNGEDVWRCMHEANCDITDDRTQMAIFRDPRPAIVSTYYHVMVHNKLNVEDFDVFIARESPILCQWLVVRYTLFTGALAHQSMELWYEDAMIDPLGWHYDWFFLVGLQLPFGVVQAIAQEAVSDEIYFDHTGIDVHPGEEHRDDRARRRFEDEVSPEMLDIADDVLRTWLPPVLLERLGVAP